MDDGDGQWKKTTERFLEECLKRASLGPNRSLPKNNLNLNELIDLKKYYLDIIILNYCKKYSNYHFQINPPTTHPKR